MDEQEAVQWMIAGGFEDITAQYNAENQSCFTYVFFHPNEGPRGLWCFCDECGDIFGALRFLEGRLGRE